MNAKKHQQRRRWRNRQHAKSPLAFDANGNVTAWHEHWWGFFPPPGPTQRLAWPRGMRWRAIETCPF